MTREEYGKAYSENFARTVNFLCSTGFSKDLATEMAQAAWARGWEMLRQLRDPRLVRPWVNQIAKNTHRSMRRKEQGAVLVALDERHPATATIDFVRIELEKAFKFLRVKDRTLFELRLAGYSDAEIAGRNGATVTAIRIRFVRARRAARAGLQKQLSE